MWTGAIVAAFTFIIIIIIYLFILTANGVLPGGGGNQIRHNKQITHITQNNTTIKQIMSQYSVRSYQILTNKNCFCSTVIYM
jgi:hypothetical protein